MVTKFRGASTENRTYSRGTRKAKTDVRPVRRRESQSCAPAKVCPRGYVHLFLWGELRGNYPDGVRHAARHHHCHHHHHRHQLCPSFGLTQLQPLPCCSPRWKRRSTLWSRRSFTSTASSCSAITISRCAINVFSWSGSRVCVLFGWVRPVAVAVGRDASPYEYEAHERGRRGNKNAPYA